jgi:hypothetical protein
MTELTQDTTIDIEMTDLAEILTEVFCGSYTPFKNLYVENVRVTGDGENYFELSLSKREAEAV